MANALGVFGRGNVENANGLSRISNFFGLSNPLKTIQEQNNEYAFAEMQYANELEQSNARQANQIAQENAAIAYDRQLQLQTDAMKFNAEEAQKARDYDTMMSNTQYQRAVEDMKAAGINPILAFSNGGASYSGGQAASIGPSTASQASSYMASAQRQDIDQTSNRELTKTRMQIIGNLLSTYINSAARVESSRIAAVSRMGGLGSLNTSFATALTEVK